MMVQAELVLYKIFSQVNIQQIKASGSGSGGAGSGSPLDPDQESDYLFYARSDFSVDKKLFFGSVSGSAVDQILGLGRIKFTGASGRFTSSNLVGSEQRLEANIINSVTGKFRYDASYKDPSPTIEFSRDGGLNWFQATLKNPASATELWLADYSWPSMDTRSSGNANGSVTTDRMLSIIITPDYDQVITSFDFLLGTSSTSGTVNAYIKGVTLGVPNTTIIAQSPVTINLGTDVTSTRQLLNFPITPVTLLAGNSYAITVEASSGATINTESTSSSASWAISGATNNGSGWVANSNKYKVNLYSAGNDLRVRVTSSSGSDYRLLGFGVDFVLVGPATVSGVVGQETRTITASEASSGIINFTNITYTPGARQLIAKTNNHVFMGPEDFVEASPTSITFTPGFFSAGQIVTFYVTYGLVDGSSQSLSKINAEWDAIVGSQSQAASGIATHSSLASALASFPNGHIMVLDEYSLNESINITGSPLIEGHGSVSDILGNVTVSGNYAIIRGIRFKGSLTISGNGNYIQQCFSDTGNIIDTGSGNLKQIIVGT